jgi:hypothetical protein
MLRFDTILEMNPFHVSLPDDSTADTILDAEVELITLRNKGAIPYAVYYKAEGEFKAALRGLKGEDRLRYAKNRLEFWRSLWLIFEEKGN